MRAKGIRSRMALVTGAVVALVCFGGTACGGGDSASAAETIRAASKNSGAKSVGFEMEIKISGVPGEDFATAAEGVYDLDKKQAQMVMDLMGEEVTAILDGTSMYINMPFLGEGWIKQDLTERVGENPFDNAQDPTQVLSWLQATGEDVEEIGSDQIRGEKATHYRTMLDLRDLLDGLEGERRKSLEQTLDLLGQGEIEVDVWVNDADLPVRIRYEMSFANSGIKALEDAVMKFHMEYFDWGKPVRIDLPDPKDVREG